MIVLLYLDLGFLDVPKTPGKAMYLLSLSSTERADDEAENS